MEVGPFTIYHYASHVAYQLKVANSRPVRDLRSVLHTTIEGRSCPPPKILNPSCICVFSHLLGKKKNC
jgi:hypothetical protein